MSFDTLVNDRASSVEVGGLRLEIGRVYNVSELNYYDFKSNGDYLGCILYRHKLNGEDVEFLFAPLSDAHSVRFEGVHQAPESD